MAFRLSVALAIGLAMTFCTREAAAARPHITVKAGHYNGRLWTAVTNDGDVKITRIKWVVRFVEGPRGEETGKLKCKLKPGKTVNFFSNLQVPPGGTHWRADHTILSIYAGGKWVEP